MFKKLLVIIVLIVGLYQTSKYLVETGRLDNYMDSHPDPGWVPAVEYNLGQLYEIFAKWEKAIERYERIQKNFEEDEIEISEKVQYAKARAYDKTGEKNRAIMEYQSFLKKYPDSKHTGIARKRAEYLKSL